MTPPAEGTPIHIISLGAGVQSSTMALMAAAGEITPMPTCAIFADTQDEPASVYRWLDWLEKQLPFPVYRVTAGRLSDFATRVRTSKKGRRYFDIKLPWFTQNEDGSKGIIGMRNCTEDFKIIPIRRKVRELAKIKRAQKTVGVIQWIGISLDEVHRMKPSRELWQQNRWPLIDARITRNDCLRWMENRGFPKPPRSACVYCPFHSDSEWARLKREDPQAFLMACEFEKKAQANRGDQLRSTVYLHRSNKALSEVDFSTDIDRGQMSMFGNECEGMCGV
jgi:hypothetical protein